jgi:hypothetical protein
MKVCVNWKIITTQLKQHDRNQLSKEGMLGGLLLEKLAAPYSPPSLQWQNGTILSWLCHRWTTCLNPSSWGWTWYYKWHIIHPEGGVDVMLVDVVNGCQTDQRMKCPSGRSIWWRFCESKNVQWTFRWWTFHQGTNFLSQTVKHFMFFMFEDLWQCIV